MSFSFENIIFEDSYILGWENEACIKKFTIYVEFLLTEDHPLFTKFDKKTEYGCYKLGKIIINNVKCFSGLDKEYCKLQWNDELGEYCTIAEIDKMEISDDYSEILINADEYEIIVKGSAISIEFSENIDSYFQVLNG